MSISPFAASSVPLQHFQLQFVFPVHEAETCLFVGHQIDQDLLHGADHAGGIDHVAGTRITYELAVAAVGLALCGDGGVVIVIGRGHRPAFHVFQGGIAEREIAEVPVPSAFVLHPFCVDAPDVDLAAGWSDVEWRPRVGRDDFHEVDAQGLAESLIVVGSQIVVGFQAAIDSLVRQVVDGDAVGSLVIECAKDAFS